MSLRNFRTIVFHILCIDVGAMYTESHKSCRVGIIKTAAVLLEEFVVNLSLTKASSFSQNDIIGSVYRGSGTWVHYYLNNYLQLNEIWRTHDLLHPMNTFVPSTEPWCINNLKQSLRHRCLSYWRVLKALTRLGISMKTKIIADVVLCVWISSWFFMCICWSVIWCLGRLVYSKWNFVDFVTFKCGNENWSRSK